MNLNLDHGSKKKTTFKFKLSGVQHNLMDNTFFEGNTNISIVSLHFRIREDSLYYSKKKTVIFILNSFFVASLVIYSL